MQITLPEYNMVNLTAPASAQTYIEQRERPREICMARQSNAYQLATGKNIHTYKVVTACLPGMLKSWLDKFVTHY